MSAGFLRPKVGRCADEREPQLSHAASGLKESAERTEQTSLGQKQTQPGTEAECQKPTTQIYNIHNRTSLVLLLKGNYPTWVGSVVMGSDLMNVFYTVVPADGTVYSAKEGFVLLLLLFHLKNCVCFLNKVSKTVGFLFRLIDASNTTSSCNPLVVK